MIVFLFIAGNNNNINACILSIITCSMSLICKIIERNIVELPLKGDLIWTRARDARPQIAGDKSADARFPASQILMITPLLHVLCEWFAAAWSAAKSFKNGSIWTSPHEGTLRLENSDLWYCSRNWPSSDKPLQIACLIYSWPLLPLSPPVNFPHSPQGQLSVLLDKVAEQLLCYRLPTLHPPRLHLLCSCAPITLHIQYVDDYVHLPAAAQGVRGERTCWQHKMASNWRDVGKRYTVKGELWYL